MFVAIIMGALIGWVAGKLMRANVSMLMTVILGIIGSGVGNFLASCIGISATNSIGGILIGIAGACVVILCYRWLMSKKE